MNRVIFIAAALLLAACTKTGDIGPQGPQGTQGTPGIAGTSVTAVQLDPGNLSCPDGGSEFTSASGITRACSGAQGAPGVQGNPGAKGDPGIQGPAGPRVVVKTASGSLLGPVLGISGPDQGFVGSFAVYVQAYGRFGRVAQATGHFEGCAVYFESSDCSGVPHLGNGAMDMVCRAGARIWTVASTTLASITYYSYLNNPEGVCYGIPAGSPGTVMPALELFDARYPYAAPLQIAYE